MLACVRNCGHARAFRVPSIVPTLEAMGFGGFNRSDPTGGWAYGMPLKESTPEELEPTTVAYDRVTVGEAARFSIVGAASVRGRTETAKLIRYFILSDRHTEAKVYTKMKRRK